MHLHFQILSCLVDDADIFSKSDVFCTISFQGVKKTTEIIKDDLNPIWGEKGVFIFPYDDECDDNNIFVDVFDSDGWTSEHLQSVSFQINVKDQSVETNKNDVYVKYSLVHLHTENDVKYIRKCALNDVQISILKVLSKL